MTTYFISVLVRVTLLAMVPAAKLPLSTKSSWIVDSTGVRVKLACVSWAGHLEAGIPEGLSRNRVENIAELIKLSGFNCVRLTSSTWLWTEPSFGSLTVAENFQRLNLTAATAGMQTFNPELLELQLPVVYYKVVETLAAQDVMVILDNHVSKPQWCCSDTDGNGFWGDEFFDTETWILGLATVARLFKTNAHVVAMSLRNELRGPRQNSLDWEIIVPRAVALLHALNPNILVIAGGLSYESDLSFLGSYGDDVVAHAPGKFMYEFHWYKWYARDSNFDDPNESDACAVNVRDDVLSKAHSPQVLKVPYFLSEFGIDEAGDNYGDARYLDCVIAYLRESGEAWGLWALQGSYYLRDGVQDYDEEFGVLDSSWQKVRNPDLISKLRPIQGCV